MSKTKPPFRADHPGSYLRPAALQEARAKHARKEIGDADLRKVEEREIEAVIRKQEEVGLQAVTDGEFRRSWWHLDFLRGLDGLEHYTMNQGMQFKGTPTRAEGVRVKGKIGYSGHPMIEHFKFLQSRTKVMPKMAIPSPSALFGRRGREAVDDAVYPSLANFFADLGAAYRKAVKAFCDAGCKYIQLDEVFLAMICDPHYCETFQKQGLDPHKLAEIYGDLINVSVADVPAGTATAMHLCRGNFRSTFLGSGGYEPIVRVLFERIRIGGYFMEYDTERAGGFEPLRLMPKGATVVLGLVTSKEGKLESKDAIKRRIDAAAKFVPLDRLCLSTQCGFASTEEGNILSEEEQWAKMRFIVGVAKEVWG